ncbi:hypothetical protein M9Y10_035455 [Tritrichomonas musculus]|uniref:Protein kinase domain-containing protein n=1 Tax=Tritrichomonas musculus TaxID=1915356 RepID=A0ABR2KHP1_9EUKA
MGNFFSNVKNFVTSPYKSFDEHPLLKSIKNPINRFCDDFASSLIDDYSTNSQKKDIQMTPNDQEEIYGFTIVKILGDGAEAVVYEAYKNRTSAASPDSIISLPIALKKYKKVSQMGQGVLREFEIANLLHHPHCIKMYECVKNAVGEYIISMPLYSYGSLSYSNVPVLTISASILFLKQLGSALAYMHSRNVIHRDIKPGNVLIYENGFVFCDYSVSVHLNSPDEKLSGVVGTSVFMSCEISNDPYLPKPCDVWALGVTTYVLLYGKFPYHLELALEQNEAPVWNNTSPIIQCVNSYGLEFPNVPSIPNEMKKIIAGMLEKDPNRRLTAKQIDENKWINEKYERRKKIMNYMTNID